MSDTAAGQDIPRKRGPGVTKSDLLVVNKTDLAPHVGVDPALLEADAARARAGRAYVMAQIRHGKGGEEVVDFIVRHGGLVLSPEGVQGPALAATGRQRWPCGNP